MGIRSTPAIRDAQLRDALVELAPHEHQPLADQLLLRKERGPIRLPRANSNPTPGLPHQDLSLELPNPLDGRALVPGVSQLVDTAEQATQSVGKTVATVARDPSFIQN